MQIIGLLLCFLVIIAAFPRLYDVFTKHMEKLADEELQKYMQANNACTGLAPTEAQDGDGSTGASQ